MKWVLFLLVIILTKIALTKGSMLVLILLSFWLKGKSINKSSAEWNKYLLTLKETFINKYVIMLYCISTILSSCAAFILFRIFGFQDPVFKTLVLTVICVILSIMKYIKKGKKEVMNGLRKIHKFARKEQTEHI